MTDLPNRAAIDHYASVAVRLRAEGLTDEAMLEQVREAIALWHTDETPDYLGKRTLSLRGFDEGGMLKDALLAMPGEADAQVRALFGRPDIATIHAHSAAYGCFLARIERN